MEIFNEENMQKFVVSSKVHEEPDQIIAAPTVSNGEIEEINDESDAE